MAGLTARKLAEIPSTDGIQADVALLEPNGDEHVVRCLCKFDGTTDIGEVGDGSVLGYLSDRYGSQAVWALTRQVTLSGH